MLKKIAGLHLTMLLIVFGLSAQFHQMYQLPYNYDALEPYIDAQTMEIHYSRHHNAYTTNLNNATVGTRVEKMPIEDLLIAAERRGAAIRNNGGGHYNHNLFWKILSPNPQSQPTGRLADDINQTFASLDSLKKLMNTAATKRFGSGWVWLYVTPQKKLAVSSTANQDNPIMDAALNERGIPILGIDVWEHAYYLKYQNKRGDYLGAVWNVINWGAVENLYQEALTSPLLKVIEKDSWKELKEFHMVMGQTFHPMEEGNLEPIRKRSKEMYSKAVALSKAPIPASFDNAAIKNAISRLVSGSMALDKLIAKKGKEDKIKASLTSLHDIFHEIQGLCQD